MVVRCPYCVRFDHFMTMSLRADGTYVCAKCGHRAIPENKRFQCPCRRCLAMDAFKPQRDRTYLTSA